MVSGLTTGTATEARRATGTSVFLNVAEPGTCPTRSIRTTQRSAYGSAPPLRAPRRFGFAFGPGRRLRIAPWGANALRLSSVRAELG